MSDRSDVHVTNNPDEHRYEARIDGALAGVAEYQRTHELVVFTHTEVNEAYEGKGVGGALARYALDDIRTEGTHKIMPLCPFIKGWISQHRDYIPLVYGAPASTAKD